MNWQEYVIWTDTTAKPEGDVWDSLREGLIEECHEALAAWHEIKAIEHGAIKRKYRDGEPTPDVLALRQSFLDAKRRKLIKEVGDACWYAARICRVSKSDVYFAIRAEDWRSMVLEIGVVEKLLIKLDGKNGKSLASVAVNTVVELTRATGRDREKVLMGNVSTLTARKAAETITGEGER